MDGIEALLALLAVGAILSGPIALIVALTALKRIREIHREIETLSIVPPADRRAGDRPHVTPVLPGDSATPAEPLPAAPVVPEPVETVAVSLTASPPAADRRREALALEQRIGTRWALVAGVITIVFAVGFFLKYAYEAGWIGPLGRVLIAAAGGLLALTIGEATRRRGYDFAAKGVTALGFAILYATVFAAHRWYGLIGPAPAYVLASAITAAAMLYAVVLDEVIVAVLSLLGGYITPVVLSRGENLPTLLFSYVLILSAGAALCAYRRRWSAVSILAFVGTYGLYSGWWWRFYQPALERGVTPQLGIALVWLAVFFFIYLLVPLVHTLVRRTRAQSQDVLLVLLNGGVVLYYLAAMLLDEHRSGLALASGLMGVAYLGLAVVVLLRCPDDGDLRLALLLAGLAFASLAVPLYFRGHVTALVWTLEALALAAVGLRYRNLVLQAVGGVAAVLALSALLYSLPQYTRGLRPVFNANFGTWSFVAAALLAGHVLYRLDRHLDRPLREAVTQALYAAGLLLLLAAVGLELWHVSGRADRFFEQQMILALAVFLPLFVARPLPPPGPACPLIAVGMGVIGSIFLLPVYAHWHGMPFAVFANTAFLRALVFVAALFAGAWLVRRDRQGLPEQRAAGAVLGWLGILVLWLVMTLDIWVHYRLDGRANWRLLAHMYISVLWAMYASALLVIGLLRRSRPVRYLALGIFVLLLAKIFLVDTRRLDVMYRIAGFLATGLALVGVSYLYQYLKKKGFFETPRPENDAAPDR